MAFCNFDGLKTNLNYCFQDEPEDFPNIPSNAQRTILEDEAKESRDFVMREEFLKRTTDKSIFNEIKRLVGNKQFLMHWKSKLIILSLWKVNCAKAAQENDLNKKRERLAFKCVINYIYIEYIIENDFYVGLENYWPTRKCDSKLNSKRLWVDALTTTLNCGETICCLWK